jgi:hypothetical protein
MVAGPRRQSRRQKITPTSHDPILLHNCQTESLESEPATARLVRDPAARYGLWFPSSTIRVCIPYHSLPLPPLQSSPVKIAKFAKFANFSSFD